MIKNMTITYYKLGYLYEDGGRNGEPDFSVEVYCVSFNKQDCIDLAKKYNITYEEHPGVYYTGFVLYTITQTIEETTDEDLLQARLNKIKEDEERRKRVSKVHTPFGFDVEDFLD